MGTWSCEICWETGYSICPTDYPPNWKRIDGRLLCHNCRMERMEKLLKDSEDYNDGMILVDKNLFMNAVRRIIREESVEPKDKLLVRKLEVEDD